MLRRDRRQASRSFGHGLQERSTPVSVPSTTASDDWTAPRRSTGLGAG
jgi:hypothetical protein